MTSIGKVFQKLIEMVTDNREHWAEGGSLVFIPRGREHEIHILLREHREEEAKRALEQLLFDRRI